MKSLTAILLLVTALIGSCTACAPAGQGLVIAGSTGVTTGTSEWREGDAVVDLDDYHFTTTSNLSGTQDITVQKPGLVEFTSEDSTQTPEGMRMTWTLYDSLGVKVRDGNLKELLVHPVVLDLPNGDYVLSVDVDTTLGYRPAPYDETLEPVTVPRIKVRGL